MLRTGRKEKASVAISTPLSLSSSVPRASRRLLSLLVLVLRDVLAKKVSNTRQKNSKNNTSFV